MSGEDAAGGRVLMTPEDYTAQLKKMKIRDGLLCEFVAQGLYTAALSAIDSANMQRRHEIIYLDDLRHALVQEILNQKEITDGSDSN